VPGARAGFLRLWPSSPLDERRSRAYLTITLINHLVNMASDPLSATFSALADPTRRAILARLADGPCTVKELSQPFSISAPAITKHLRVLEETGVVRREVVGRTHRLSLEPDVLSEAADWMDRQRVLWGRMFDVVDEYLKEDENR